MICSKCHRALNSTAKVCPYCGETVYHSHQYGEDAPDVHYRHKVKKSKGFKSFATGFLIFALLVGAATIAAYYTYNYFMGNSAKEYTGLLAGICNRIDNANSEIADTLKNEAESFPASDVLSKTGKVRDSLNKIAEDLSNISPPSAYSASQDKLQEALKLNKMIYTQLETLLKNPADADIKKNEEQLYKYIQECSEDYAGVNVKGIEFSLPKEIVSMSEKLGPWVSQKQSEYAKISALMSSFSKYFQDISQTLLSYEAVRVDITQALNKSRTEKNSWDELLSLIDKNEKAVSDAKASYIKIKVPSYLRAFNDRLGPILDNTLSYYNKLKQAVMTDMDFDEEAEPDPEKVAEKIDQIDAMYEEAEKINTETSDEYKKFTQDIETEKSKYMDAEYVMKLTKK